MMGTVIFVLKVIGILLGAVLSVVLLLLFLALFCRVRYDVAVDAGETITGKVRFRWLWFVVRFSAVYNDGDTNWVLRVLGIPIKRQKAPGKGKKFRKKAKKVGRDKETAEKNMEPAAIKSEDMKSENRSPSGADPAEKNLKSQGELSGNGKELEKKEVSKEETFQQGEVQHRASGRFAKIFVKIRGFLLKIRGVFGTIRNIGKRVAGFIKDLPQLLQDIGEKKDAVLSFLKDKHVQAFLKLSKTQMGYLLAHLKPKKVQGFIRFGTGNPCSTGQILGAAAMAFPLYGSWLRIAPEFEEKHFSGYFKARGKIRLFRVILIGKRWFLADTSKRCLNTWNKLKEELIHGR